MKMLRSPGSPNKACVSVTGMAAFGWVPGTLMDDRLVSVKNVSQLSLRISLGKEVVGLAKTTALPESPVCGSPSWVASLSLPGP